MMPPGLHPDVPMAAYLAMNACGASDLWTMSRRCPAEALHRKVSPNHETLATALGTAVHSFLLEGDSFEALYAVRPVGLHGASNAYKAWAAEQANAGKRIVSRADMETMQAIRDNLPPKARKLLSRGRSEMTALCFNEASGLHVKCRPDWLRDEGVTVNLKTAADLEPRAWGRAAFDYGYHVSAALTTDILREVTGDEYEYYWLVVAKEPPFLSYIAQMSPMDIALGRATYQTALMTWTACAKANEWPAWGDVVDVALPPWAHPKEMAE
jgi:exodeoxyribonuclease VIII